MAESQAVVSNYERFMAKFIAESDLIEGIENDLTELERQVVEEKPSGHVGAILLLEDLAQNGHLLTEEVVKRTQYLIVSEQHTKLGSAKRISNKYLGNFRDVQVIIGDRHGVPVGLIESSMDCFLSEVNDWQRKVAKFEPKQKMEKIALFHFVFELIHPFIDGNGRTGRALAYYMMKFAKLLPFIFTNSDKHQTYYKCFDKKEFMIQYFLKKSGWID